MPNPYFNFKRFTICHDRSSMKVGTDGVLLGAWAGKGLREDGSPMAILDVGTGSGLIALMLAQRFEGSHVDAIDIHDDSVAQAACNAQASVFADRIHVCKQDFCLMGEDFNGHDKNLKSSDKDFNGHDKNLKSSDKDINGHDKNLKSSDKDFKSLNKNFKKYDLIVSNPPFYIEDTLSGNSARDNARHTSSLPFEVLIGGASKLLNEDGLFAVIIPYSSSAAFVGSCALHGLYLLRRTDVRSTERKPFKRSLLEFGRHAAASDASVLTLYSAGCQRSDEYAELTQDFYL